MHHRLRKTPAIAFLIITLLLSQGTCTMQHTPLPAIETTIKPGIYRHYKTCQEYRVVAVGRHSEDLEPYVIYQECYGNRNYWLRPAAMFQESLDYEGKRVPRFTFVSENQEGAR